MKNLLRRAFAVATLASLSLACSTHTKISDPPAPRDTANDKALDRAIEQGAACERTLVSTLLEKQAWPTSEALKTSAVKMVNCPGFVAQAFKNDDHRRKLDIAAATLEALPTAFATNADVLKKAFTMENQILGSQILAVVFDEFDNYGHTFWTLLRDSESLCKTSTDRQDEFCALKRRLENFQRLMRAQAESQRGEVIKGQLDRETEDSLLSVIEVMYGPLLKEGFKTQDAMAPQGTSI